MRRLIKTLYLLALVAGACTLPAVQTLTPQPTLTPTASATLTATPSPTFTATGSPTPTLTLTATSTVTDTPTITATASRTPRPTWTPQATLSPDWVDMTFSEQITVTPWADDCLFTFYDVKIFPGWINIWRRDKLGYLFCVGGQ